ncbi:MAG: ribonuclease P protein component [Chloroflexi bacterium]|nr:ribonuclease P protein component [Chloroflexota bacterium]MYJ58821.1 ribonuclease P protein component [Chloroflexota bacterium]
MPAEQRLRRKSDFDAVFREGIRASQGPLALRARARGQMAEEQPCRFGFAVSSRLGGAVQRNRIRRRLRESVRQLNLTGDCAGLDVVVIARQGAVEADFHQLDATLRSLVRRSLRQLRADGGAS